MRNLEYSRRSEYGKNRVMSIYVDGNAARKIDEERPVRTYIDEEERRRRRRREEAQARSEQTARRQAAIVRTVVLMAAAAIMMFLVISLLNGTVRTNALTTEINGLENEYKTMVSQNDSKEYDINRSVDLNMIIKTATEEYGMVRGSVDQIITYKTDDSEYIQQIAEIPRN